MKKLLIIGNWKMNKTYDEARDFINAFSNAYALNGAKISENIEYGIAPSFTNMSLFNKELLEKTNINLVAQNINENRSGAFTGEISAQMLKSINAKYVIVGHSERRQNYRETNKIVNQKAKAAIENGLIPIICVGESLEEYEAGKTKAVIKKQIKQSLEALDLSKIVVAYEPIWAIGTGKVATAEVAQQICKFIRSITSKDLIIQYGGSVSPSNIENLMKQEDIDGALVGGASLEVDSFFELITFNALK
ncbi:TRIOSEPHOSPHATE ISOMERASE(TIM) [Mycoplasmopsis pulmonis]|uniref:Triosephosphate isomerase n=1 Tax=Mycoplasmopsis pulmonis (strain UAB CTIP) TaxID=272635 RepID=TPIS_MYCPU|nr:triose-phosphate isomerase [Mycoplasmopsis pulmonis]Q98QA8.1 RecName: Full=Triosephosphate isomerase; Short=TIM; Short=TPI; AltName: Full=Triose-phosphate isomerase [Mycoplasmopsis pulmonis UAB CTIP]MDZ7293532.1 triose-phosphate isomerase [Mycoplasmopsis pulmonis]CAC13631.1 TRIOSEPHOSPHATE ISOMERASE(TIM) [Mycoplasmopsis pulmonis]VEU68222.1 Triosephosphate isomerase [Mycoplasmopsis pulmonis]